MLKRRLTLALATVLALGCGGAPPAGDPPAADATAPEIEEVRDLDAIHDLNRSRKEELYAALGEDPPAPPFFAPDLVPREPRLVVQTDFATVDFRARNVGQLDAGPFTLRAVIDMKSANGVEPPTIVHEEEWPGIPAGERVTSDEFINQADLLALDISGMERPITLTIGVYVDHISATMQYGRVLELNEGLMDNFEVYELTIL